MSQRDGKVLRWRNPLRRWRLLFVAVASVPLPAGQRRRQRPYLNWVERSRDNWKQRAVAARADANRLDRRVRSLTASRDRWRQQAFDARQQLRLARLEPAKN